MFETYNYKGNSFTVWEYENYFLVVTNNESYKLNSMADVREFIKYYKGDDVV